MAYDIANALRKTICDTSRPTSCKNRTLILPGLYIPVNIGILFFDHRLDRYMELHPFASVLGYEGFSRMVLVWRKNVFAYAEGYIQTTNSEYVIHESMRVCLHKCVCV